MFFAPALAVAVFSVASLFPPTHRDQPPAAFQSPEPPQTGPDTPQTSPTMAPPRGDSPPSVLRQIPVLVDAQTFANSTCSASDMQAVAGLRRKSFLGYYVIGPAVAALVNGYLYHRDHRLRPASYGISLGAGVASGVSVGSVFLTKANRRQLTCLFPREQR